MDLVSQDSYCTKGHLTDMWEHMSDAAKKKATQRWVIEKPKLDNAAQLRGIFFIEPEDGGVQTHHQK